MAAVTAPGPIRVTIDRLVLHGVAHADAAAVERALTAELRARLSAMGPDLPADSAEIQLSIPPTSGAAELGRSAGAGIANSLSAPRGGR